jgi:acyl CoA:acetate/3-ketoacid CoA transferase beta subunit
VEPELGRLVRRVHVVLPSAVGVLTVESVPPGAEVRVDGNLAGKTPVTLSGVRVDEPHRVDLTLPGHEVDQFVVFPEKDGNRFVRQLVPRPRGKG